MAKILLASKDGIGASYMLRWLEEGHSVDYYLKEKEYANALCGLVPDCFHKQPDFTKYDLVVFDVTGMPKLAEQSALLAPTIGDGNLASQLEDDRMFGIEVMEEVGINVPFYEQFDDIGEAKKFVKKTNKRYVFKPFTPPGGEEQDSAITYVSKSAEDLIQYLDRLGELAGGTAFILQEVVSGIEVSMNAYFNGNDFYFLTSTFEEKKFMEGGRGPNTGCSGNLIFAYSKPPFLYKEGLEKLKPFLQQYGFRGPIDLNSIVSDTKLYGLEWTPRFGYDSSATENCLIRGDIVEFLGSIATGQVPQLDIPNPFSASIRLTVPPYPTLASNFAHEDVPIEGIDDSNYKDFYLYDCCLDRRDSLVTAGISGFIAAPVAAGESIEQAFSRVQGLIDKVHIPDLQYRGDILQCCAKRFKIVESQGWLG